MPYSNLGLFTPELCLCGLGLLVLIVDLFVAPRARWLAPTVAVVGLAACLRPILELWGTAPCLEFSGSYAVDATAVFFKAFFAVVGILVVLLSVGYAARPWGQAQAEVGDASAAEPLPSSGEFYSLIVFLVLGMCLMAGANDLILIYLSFELVSLTSYLMAAWRKTDRGSSEAGVKYFVYGAAASGVMLYGMTLVYAAGGTTNLTALSQHFLQPVQGGGLALLGVLGLLLMMVGLGYKISMVPFQAWAPDVYQGAPTPVTALLSVGPKAAGFALIVRFFYTLGPALHVPWQMVFAILAVLTMFTGNLLAIRQTNVKRMLAYSSIAHAGYLLIGFVVGPTELWGLPGILVYLVAYLLMNLGMFAVAIILERAEGDSELSRFAGLAQSAPGLAAMTVILLLSLTGIPPTAGFLGKVYIFAAAIKSREWAWLAVVGIINSVISLYYYMNIARLMYFQKDGGTALQRVPAVLTVTMVLCALGTLGVCIFPDWLVEAARLTMAAR